MAESSNITNRKIRKPLMERKRRARINKSLNELQQILTDSEYTPKNTKLEKADILELTVQYLKKINEKSEYSQENKENLENLFLEKYIMGYKNCAEEVNSMVTQSQDLDRNIKNKINYYLFNCLEKLRKLTINHIKAKSFKMMVDLDRSKEDLLNYSKLVDGSNEIGILHNTLQNGNVILLLSSNLKEGESTLKRNGMWRPW